MAQLADVFNLIQSKEFYVTIFGATAEFLNQFQALTTKVGQAIMDEQELTEFEEAITLPPGTELDETATEAFCELQDFYLRSVKCVTS